MREHTTQVGMDVHARSIVCKAPVVTSGEVKEHCLRGSTMVLDLLEWLGKLPQPVRLAYESGCTGHELARTLKAAGFSCDIAAATSIPKSPKNNRHKNDRNDASILLREMPSPASDISYVWIPDRETEGARDLVRAYTSPATLVSSRRRRIAAFLLRHGCVWNERTSSGRLKSTHTATYRAWVASCDLGCEGANLTLKLMPGGLCALEESRAAFKESVEGLRQSLRWAPYVDAISLPLGIGSATALPAAAEFGSLSRFSSGRKVSRWIGCSATDRSSGPRCSPGHIPREGPTLLRRLLIEGSASICRRKDYTKRHVRTCGVSPEIGRLARKANRRLKSRFDELVDAGKHPNVARVAVVRELACWIWVIGLKVESGIGSMA